MITTVSERRQNFHQAVIGSSLAQSSSNLRENVNAIASHLMQRGFSRVDAVPAAYATIYHELQRQAAFLAFMDCFRVIAWLTIGMVPLVLFVKRFATAGKVPEGGH